MNIFVSRPTLIAPEFEDVYKEFHAFLVSEHFEPRRLGGGTYSKKAFLRAVDDTMKLCSGAIVLGYPTEEMLYQVFRKGEVQKTGHLWPTPWNHIEGALAYSMGLPLLVVAHEGIQGGVFDDGATGESVIRLDLAAKDWFKDERFTQPYAEWLEDLGKAAGTAKADPAITA